MTRGNAVLTSAVATQTPTDLQGRDVALSVNYPNPVWVNGFECRNCTDVDNAKKHIDPAHPKSGPFGVDAKADPTRTFQDAVSLGGVLAGLSQSSGAPPAPTPAAQGAQLDLHV